MEKYETTLNAFRVAVEVGRDTFFCNEKDETTTLIFFSSPKYQSSSLQFRVSDFLLLPLLLSISLSLTPFIASTKKITLKSSDGVTFDVDEAVALQSQTIKHVIENDCADNGIPLPNVTGEILAKVIENCKKHVEMPKDRATEDELRAWDTEFVKIDQAVPFDLILAANYLNIKSLLDLTCQTVADMIKGKTPDEIYNMFNLKSPFTPEEEEEVRRENAWAFEDSITPEEEEEVRREKNVWTFE